MAEKRRVTRVRNDHRAPSHCWLGCGARAELFLWQRDYGYIISFCEAHRPELRVSVATAFAEEAEE